MNKYQNIVGKINYWLFLIVAFSLMAGIDLGDDDEEVEEDE